MRTIIGIAAAVAILLFGTAVGVMSMTPPDYSIARGALIGSAGAMAILVVCWETNAEPLRLKIAVGVAAIALLVWGFPAAFQYIESRDAATQLENVSKLSDREIKDHVFVLSKKLRRLEEVHNEKIQKIVEDFIALSRASSTKELQHDIWLKQINTLNDEVLSFQIEYRRLYFRDVSALDNEIKTRLGVAQPTELGANRLGMLAGVDPLNDIANYLETEAAKLP